MRCAHAHARIRELKAGTRRALLAFGSDVLASDLLMQGLVDEPTLFSSYWPRGGDVSDTGHRPFVNRKWSAGSEPENSYCF